MLLFAAAVEAVEVQRVFTIRLRIILILIQHSKKWQEIADGITIIRKAGKACGKTQQLENLRGLPVGVKGIQHKRSSMELPRGIETVLEGLKKE